MSVASVVRRGYGSGIRFLATRGYLSGGAVATAQSGVQRLINSNIAEMEERRLIKVKQYLEEEALMQFMFQYYTNNL